MEGSTKATCQAALINFIKKMNNKKWKINTRSESTEAILNIVGVDTGRKKERKKK